MSTSINCTPLSQYGAGITVRPAKSQTVTPRVPPLYRNPFFFTSGGQPKLTFCTATSTGYATGTQTRFGADKGKVQLGNPVAGTWQATTTASGGFAILPAPVNHKAGVRTGQGTRIQYGGYGGGYGEWGRSGQVGEFNNTYPYIYSYTYATLRNDEGMFGPGKGPGNFNIKYTVGVGSTVASITVKQGPAKFGGTMKMLGALTTKQCYWLQAGGGGCSLNYPNWLYDWVGAGAHTNGGVVTMGITVTSCGGTFWECWSPFPSTTPVTVVGSRFPWTTGSVTVTAVGRGPHRTVHYAHGYDNRNTTTSLGKGTIQLVSPILTRWHGYVDFDTGGIGVFRIKFVPEPRAWVMLIAGVSCLVTLHRRGSP
jgi:hypothetical protein